MSRPVVPAVIPTSCADLQKACDRLAFSLELHVDVVDGEFVPFVSWPYNPAGNPIEARTATDRFTLEVDLMVKKPLLAAERWLAAGADMLVFHVETIHPEAFRQFKDSTVATTGISALNDTPDELLYQYLPHAEYVQVMGIAQIGTQGQSFDERVIERIKKIKREFPHVLVSVDGSVNEATIPKLLEAGANRFIVGSAITQSEDPAAAHFRLSALV